MKIYYAVSCQHINLITIGEPKVEDSWLIIANLNISNYRLNVLGSVQFSAVQYNYVTISTVKYSSV
jgi:hypothetical protein